MEDLQRPPQPRGKRLKALLPDAWNKSERHWVSHPLVAGLASLRMAGLGHTKRDGSRGGGGGISCPDFGNQNRPTPPVFQGLCGIRFGLSGCSWRDCFWTMAGEGVWSNRHAHSRAIPQGGFCSWAASWTCPSFFIGSARFGRPIWRAMEQMLSLAVRRWCIKDFSATSCRPFSMAW